MTAAGGGEYLNAQQHYDLLFRKLGKASGVMYKDFVLQGWISEDTLEKVGKEAQADIRKKHADYTSIEPVDEALGKEDDFSIPAKMISAMNRYLENASDGDVMVLISGECVWGLLLTCGSHKNHQAPK